MADLTADLTTEQIEEKIQLIQRQTDYTYAEAREKLELNNYNITTVIRSYLLPGVTKTKPTTPSLSINQQIYKEIRTLMDEIEVAKQNSYIQK